MIRIRFGIRLRINEMITLPAANTNITDSDITMAGSNFTVIASAEQIPNTCTVMGLLSLNGSEMSFLFFFENNASFCFTSVLMALDVFEVFCVRRQTIGQHIIYSV